MDLFLQGVTQTLTFGANMYTDLLVNEGDKVKLDQLAQVLLDSSVDIIAMLDAELNYVLLNKKAVELYGSNMVGKNILEVFPQIKQTGMYDDLAKALQGELVHNAGYKSFLDRFFDNYYIPVKNEGGVVTGIIVVGHDNTDIVQSTLALQKKNEELRKSEERYQLMTREVEDYAIVMLSNDGIIENWNVGAEKIKGYSPSEIIGKSFKEFYTKADRDSKLPDQLLATAREHGKASIEGWRVRKDGTMFWGNVVITALHDANRNITGFTKVTRDLTERKLLEDQLKNYAQQLELKNKELERSNTELSSFGYVASHDLQEPLRKIRSFGRILLEKEAQNLSAEGKDYFARMISASDRMQNLIEALLEFSRATSVDKEFELTNLNELLLEVKKELGELIESEKAVLHISPLPSLFVIPFQLKQVFSNIINNSLKYARKDVPPVIDISVRDVRPEENATYHFAGEYVCISIKDNGIGFDPKYAAKIFELFYRLHGKSEYDGSGIGLAICKKIITNHHGVIIAEGEPGKGATFHIFLPTQLKDQRPANINVSK